MRRAIFISVAASLVVLIVACSGSDATRETSDNPTNPSAGKGTGGTSGASGGTSGASGGTSGASGGTSGTSGTSGAAQNDAGNDGSKGDGKCGKPGDKGNSKGVGKYCTSIVECLGNKDAQLCATTGDENATFCTKLCKKGDGESVCGEATECICDPNGGGQCGCTPKVCLE